MANRQSCKRCGEPVIAGHHATNKKFCSKLCYHSWWNETRTKNATQADFIESRFGPLEQRRLTKAEAIWLACAFDAEGSIGIWRASRAGSKNGYRYRAGLSVSNTYKGFIDRVTELIVGGVSVCKSAKERNPQYKLCYKFTPSARILPLVLKQMLPHLIIKRKQARLVLRFCKERLQSPVRAQKHELFDQLYRECKVLNKRGI